jgi:hypothetical protein
LSKRMSIMEFDELEYMYCKCHSQMPRVYGYYFGSNSLPLQSLLRASAAKVYTMDPSTRLISPNFLQYPYRSGMMRSKGRMKYLQFLHKRGFGSVATYLTVHMFVE